VTVRLDGAGYDRVTAIATGGSYGFASNYNDGVIFDINGSLGKVPREARYYSHRSERRFNSRSDSARWRRHRLRQVVHGQMGQH
jgi:hypothetical protein